MGDENPIRTLGDYSKPSHEGYRNTIELPIGNNVLAIGLNVFQQDPSPHGRILLPDSLLNSFSPGRTAKLCNDILMFQQHQGESLSEAWNRFKDFLHKVPHHGIDICLEGLVSNFMASQDARLSKFEADFKRQQGEMTNKIDTVLKAITDRIAGALPSDTVKNPKLNTSLVLSTRSYPTIDPQCSSHPSKSINAFKAHFKEATIS
ncbi:hypothetical protein Tco_0990064 [Tanacetum coccineum]|uniref:Retrotransposon gag domain-containing protein n=1 Tax=Tanacetum coccineum TaxID=301880 RepID=A0ABQ5EVP5_9ASTR